MFSIVEMVSGYALTAATLAFVLWPLIILVEAMVGAFLSAASEGVIEFKGTRFTKGSKFWDEFDVDDGRYFLQIVLWVIAIIAYIISTFILVIIRDNTLHEAATITLGWLYSVGVWVTPLLAFAATVAGLFYSIRYTTRLSVAASKALEAVKKHEKKYHAE